MSESEGVGIAGDVVDPGPVAYVVKEYVARMYDGLVYVDIAVTLCIPIVKNAPVKLGRARAEDVIVRWYSLRFQHGRSH